MPEPREPVESDHGKVEAQPPAELTKLRRGRVRTAAGGLSAALESLRYPVDEMGMVDGVRAAGASSLLPSLPVLLPASPRVPPSPSSRRNSPGAGAGPA